jgi:hypothetical protein
MYTLLPVTRSTLKLFHPLVCPQVNSDYNLSITFFACEAALSRHRHLKLDQENLQFAICNLLFVICHLSFFQDFIKFFVLERVQKLNENSERNPLKPYEIKKSDFVTNKNLRNSLERRFVLQFPIL